MFTHGRSGTSCRSGLRIFLSQLQLPKSLTRPSSRAYPWTCVTPEGIISRWRSSGSGTEGQEP